MPKPIPEGYHSVTPYLVVHDANAAIKFYERAFGATEKFRMPMGDRVGHAELQIGDSVIMLADEFPDMGHLGPKSRGGPTSSIMLYVDDADAVVKRAVEAGATLTMPVADQFYGDRCGNIKDPFGHKWSIATHVEDVEPQELERRARQMFSQA